MQGGARAPKPKGTDSTFEQFLEFVPDAIVGVGSDGNIALVNSQAEELFGYPAAELLGQPLEVLVPDRYRMVHAKQQAEYFEQPRTRPMGVGVELFAVRSDGGEFPVEVGLSNLELDGQTVAMAAIRDISERTEREREEIVHGQLERARRLESIGQLAGGIAHDFNNILGVIMNYAEFAADEVPTDSQAHQDIEEIRRAAERAAALTRQLLIFSRREVAKTEVLDLKDLVADLENLLRRALGERVELLIAFADELWPIAADAGQMEQVLINLAVNARDAMPDGGRLAIEAENVELDDDYAYMHPDTAPGNYIRLKVSDTGAGMDPETRNRVFEPFFTTKQEGTGLGLATVYGIVTGSGGRIDIYSEPGVGTTVKIHIPVSTGAPAPSSPEQGRRLGGNGEVVLVVEDELDVRRMTERMLTKAGYVVMGAGSGPEAIELWRDAQQTIDLLLTDVIMPEMLGTELVKQARALRPDLKAIYMSGYSHEVLAPEALSRNAYSAFIEKPFNARALLTVVRDLLNRPAAAGEDV